MPLIATIDGPGVVPPPPFIPSVQQAAFLGELATGDTHILLEARAGSGKSTTCREGARRIGRRQSIYCCFNAHIAREFQADLPPSCRAATMHSLGLQLLKQTLGNVQVDGDKVERITEKYFPDRWQRPERHATGKLVGLCKNLVVSGRDRTVLLNLAAAYDVEIPTAAREEVLGVIPEVLATCLEETAVVDFDDMIWLPVMLGFKAAKSPEVLFVDEAQDLNPCQHALLDVLCPIGRLVITGDRWQSIYAFRGADSDSIPKLEQTLVESDRGLTTFPLTVTRRCPVNHVLLARNIVPDLDHLPGAIPGIVDQVDAENWFARVGPGDMILCRTNAPLVGACYRLIRSGTRAFVRGRDIGKGLLALIARLRARELPGLVRSLDDYRAAEAFKLAELRNPGPALQTLNDKCDCLLALTEGATTVDEVRQRAETMFSDLSEDGSVTLSSVHRAKGLERRHVLILRPDLLPGPWADSEADQQQERNLAYVAATRAREVLTFAGPIPDILTGRH
jgi:DNA helicase II / ATP-dependent DNA helicase PcrA